jgi:hypothetical protein
VWSHPFYLQFSQPGRDNQHTGFTSFAGSDARGAYIFAVNVPWAVERKRRRSVTGYKNGVHGDAAFADGAVTIGFTRRF